MVSINDKYFDIEVGQRLKAARLLNGLSQAKLADILGVTFQQVQKYESGANRLPAHRYSALALAIGFDVTDMLLAEHDRAERIVLNKRIFELKKILPLMSDEQYIKLYNYAQLMVLD